MAHVTLLLLLAPILRRQHRAQCPTPARQPEIRMKVCFASSPQHHARCGRADVVVVFCAGRRATLGTLRLGNANGEVGIGAHRYIVVRAVVVHDCAEGERLDLTALYRAFCCIRKRFGELRICYGKLHVGEWDISSKCIDSALHDTDHCVVLPKPVVKKPCPPKKSTTRAKSMPSTKVPTSPPTKHSTKHSVKPTTKHSTQKSKSVAPAPPPSEECVPCPPPGNDCGGNGLIQVNIQDCGGRSKCSPDIKVNIFDGACGPCPPEPCMPCPPEPCVPCVPCPPKPCKPKPPSVKPPSTKPPSTKPPSTKPPSTKPPSTKPPTKKSSTVCPPVKCPPPKCCVDSCLSMCTSLLSCPKNPCKCVGKVTKLSSKAPTTVCPPSSSSSSSTSSCPSSSKSPCNCGGSCCGSSSCTSSASSSSSSQCTSSSDCRCKSCVSSSSSSADPPEPSASSSSSSEDKHSRRTCCSSCGRAGMYALGKCGPCAKIDVAVYQQMPRLHSRKKWC